MDAPKITAKHVLIYMAVNVAIGLIVGYILYQLTKPKDTSLSTTPPNVAKQGTTPTVTTTPVTTTGEG